MRNILYSSHARDVVLRMLSLTVLFGCLFISPRALAQNSGSNAATQEGRFKIAGTVVNSLTGSALAQARVAVADTKTRRNVATVVTSEDGRFEFPNLPAGKYSLLGAKQGFITGFYEEHEQFSTAIVTAHELKTDALLLRLTPMALIRGHVTDESGEPIRKAQVTLFLQDHRGGTNRINGFSDSTTDDLGYYDFSLLRPGTYFVSATATPWYAVHPNASSQSAGSSVLPALDVAYPITYYGGATEAESASPIALKGGDHAQVDIQLTAVPAVHIIFHATSQENGGFQPPTLRKHVFDSVLGVPQGGITSVEPGVFEMTGVPPGRYTVQMNNASTGEAEQSSEVNLTREVQEMDSLRGEPLAKLKVSVKFPGDESVPKEMYIGLQDRRQRAVAYSRVDASGQAAFDALEPGKYSLVCFVPQKRYAVTRVSSAAGETASHDVVVAAGSAQELTVWVAAGIVRVEGVVQKAGKPLAGVMIVLIPKDPDSHIAFFRRDQSDFDGSFTVSGVIPGSYTIVAVEDAWGFEWLQPGVLSRYAEHGQQLNIGPLMRGTVHLPDAVEVQPR